MPNNNNLNDDAINDIEDVFQQFVVNKINFDNDINQINDIISSYFEDLTKQLKPINFITSIDNSIRSVENLIQDNQDDYSNLSQDIKELIDNTLRNKNELTSLINDSFDIQIDEIKNNKNSISTFITQSLESERKEILKDKDEICKTIDEKFQNIKEKLNIHNNKRKIITIIYMVFSLITQIGILVLLLLR